jgi:elongation factor G
MKAMADYKSEQIRNLALLGHTGAGKSSLLEALLFEAKAIVQRGRVDKGTNHADFTAQEKAHQHSLEPAFLNLDIAGHHINLVDTPGYPDFFGRALLTLPAVESVILVIHAAAGIETVTQRAFEAARNQGKIVLIVINHIDGNEQALAPLLEDIQRQFGPGCLPVNLPDTRGIDVVDCYLHCDTSAQSLLHSPSQARDNLVEAVLEEDDALMERYLEQGESLSPAQLHGALEQALRLGHLVPVCFTSAERDLGIASLLEIILHLMPSPLEANPPKFLRESAMGVEPVRISQRQDDHVLAQVFRVAIDPFFGRIGVFRLHQGTLKVGMKLFIGEQRQPIKVANMFKLQGEEHLQLNSLLPGDICALAKIDELEVGTLLHESHDEDHFYLPMPTLPQPIFGLAVSPKRRGDEQKIAEVLHKLVTEDPSLQISHNEAKGQTVLQGLGDLHLQIALEKAQSLFHLDMNTEKPAVAYRETITDSANARYRHKKQSGGAGQFGEVELMVEPLPRGAGLEFNSKVVGGAVPGQFIPAVEKGVREAMLAGPLGGFPMQDIRVTLLDGKHHSVDSKEIAFVLAGKKAFMEAIAEAGPVLLEPIVKLQISVPSDCVGDITGDLSASRGMILATQARDNHRVEIDAEAPLSTVDEYATRLKSITGGSGQFSLSFVRYQVVSAAVQQQILTEMTQTAKT